jgi:Holliday junction resolvase
MRIEPRIAERHWQAAAVEQVAEQLRAEGYEVRRQARFGDLRADLLARKGSDVLVYEFKSPTEGGDDWAQQVSLLRERAVKRGARFHLVFVRPPRESHIEVEGVEAALREALQKQFPAELDELSGHTMIEDVTGVEIDSIEVRQHETRVEGEATVSVSLNNENETWATESFPFTFDVALDRGGRLARISDLNVDTSSWFGDHGDVRRANDTLGSGEAEHEPASGDF